VRLRSQYLLAVTIAWGGALAACAASKPASTFEVDAGDAAPSDDAGQTCNEPYAAVSGFVQISAAAACRVAATSGPGIPSFEYPANPPISPDCASLCDAGFLGCELSSVYQHAFDTLNPQLGPGSDVDGSIDAASAACPSEPDGGTIELTCYVMKTQVVQGGCPL
jgi:hypothetical protein